MTEFGTFDFGLSVADEHRAAKLHADSIIIDMLFQGPVGYRAFTAEMDAKLKGVWDTTRSPEGTYGASVIEPIRLALGGEFDDFRETWEASGLTAGNRQASAESLGAHALATVQFDNFDWLVKAVRAEDFRRAKREGKRAGFVSTQNNVGAGQLALLQTAHDMGMRMMDLTYNVLSAVGAGCTERTDAGLSEFGVAVVKKMNELGVIVDTSHSGHRTTLDACEVSSKPVVASHTSADALNKSDRAKTDEEIRALAGTGGIIGVYAVPFFLASGEGVTIAAMLDHIDYISNLVGWRHVGIGTDWPLQTSKWVLATTFEPMTSQMGFRQEHGIQPEVNLIGFDDYRDFPNITRGLVKRGYTDEQVKGILGENFLRVFEEVCG